MSSLSTLQNAAASVSNVDEFRHWTRKYLRAVIPHGATIFGLGHLHAGGVGLDHIITADYPLECLDAIRNGAGAIDTPILRRWLATQQPQVFDSENPWLDTPVVWLKNFNRHRLQNVLAHAIYDHKRCVGTYHSLFRMPKTASEEQVKLLVEITPMLHEIVFRVVQSLGTKDQMAENFATLTKRERDVVQWLRLGKTNAEISKLAHMSLSTVKHYLTDIFDKFNVPNRAQLIRMLAEHENRQAPTSQTRVY